MQTDRAPKAADTEPSFAILAATSTVLVEPANAVDQFVSGACVLTFKRAPVPPQTFTPPER